MDRREGRKSDELVVYTGTLTESRRMQDLLIPESGRIYPLWVRSSSEDKLMFHDILMVPGDIAVEPVSHRRPWAKFFRIPFTEVDPRGLVPERTNDGVTAQPPDARITADPTSGRAPLTVHLTDASTGNISSRVWDLNTASDAYGTSTSATPTVTYKRAGTYTIRLTVTGALGVDVTTVKVKVT
jgi:PKD repeat protein